MLSNTQTSVTYVIPARTLAGSPRQVLKQLDEMVESLVAFRQVVASEPHAGVRAVPPQNGSPPMAR
jgi:hypothetical protein